MTDNNNSLVIPNNGEIKPTAGPAKALADLAPQEVDAALRVGDFQDSNQGFSQHESTSHVWLMS